MVVRVYKGRNEVREFEVVGREEVNIDKCCWVIKNFYCSSGWYEFYGRWVEKVIEFCMLVKVFEIGIFY